MNNPLVWDDPNGLGRFSDWVERLIDFFRHFLPEPIPVGVELCNNPAGTRGGVIIPFWARDMICEIECSTLARKDPFCDVLRCEQQRVRCIYEPSLESVRRESSSGGE